MFKNLKALLVNMIKGGIGGAKTKTGLKFEKRVNIGILFERLKGYSLKGHQVFFEQELVAELYKKHSFYKKFLQPKGTKPEKLLSKRLLPDQVVFVVNTSTVFVVEIKFQNCEGSVDEKLQTCDFKKKSYEKLVKPLGYNLEYVYVLNDWFRNKKYADTLEYISSVNCHYFFNEIPLDFLGLPVHK